MHGNQLCGFEIKFQSTLPARGATVAAIQYQADCRISIHAPRTGSDLNFFSIFNSSSYFNPRSPHGERLLMALSTATMINISIHAPRTGSDRYRAGRYNPAERISIHAPRTGSDGITAALTTRSGLFQSTLPARGATPSRWRWRKAKIFQSTLPARGATRRAFAGTGQRFLFQSTLPARGATHRRRPP